MKAGVFGADDGGDVSVLGDMRMKGGDVLVAGGIPRSIQTCTPACMRRRTRPIAVSSLSTVVVAGLDQAV